jgi:hypothetical protein
MHARQKQEKGGFLPYTCGIGNGLTPKHMTKYFYFLSLKEQSDIFTKLKLC